MFVDCLQDFMCIVYFILLHFFKAMGKIKVQPRVALTRLFALQKDFILVRTQIITQETGEGSPPPLPAKNHVPHASIRA